MQYRLRTLLILFTTLALGFGAGIATERWRVGRERANNVRLPQQSTTTVNTRGVRFGDQIRAKGEAAKARMEALKAANQQALPLP